MGRQSRRILIAAGVGILVALIGGRVASGLYVDALWYSHLGYGAYFWKLKVVRWLVSLGLGLGAGSFLAANLYPFGRLAPRLHIRRRYGNIEIAEVVPRRYLILTVVGIAVVFGWIIGLYAGSDWTLPILQFVNAPPWGTTDPIFGRDLSFYVFALPLLSGLQSLSVLVLVVTIVLVLIGHATTGGLGLEEGHLRISATAERHLGVLGGLLLLAVAFGFWVGIQELLWSGHGVTGTIGYADVAARFGAGRVLIALSVLAAIVLFVGSYRGQLLYGVVALAVLGIATLVLNHAYPTIVQQFRVEPNELERERPYLAYDIEFTRLGYGLNEFDEREYPLRIDHVPEGSAIARVTAGLPLWDRRPLRATFNQLQGINPYYTFADVDYDRYGAEQEIEQVAVAVREIDIDQLPPEARTWQNLHLSDNYTHGLGVVMTPASRVRPTGEPVYYVSGIPPVVGPEAPPEISLQWPEIYFGEETRQYVLVREEPGDERPRPLGVSLDGFHRKLSFAWTLGDKNLLLSQELQPDTRILYDRNVHERVRRLVPFLLLEADIYPVLLDGRVVWVQDAYTVSSGFPLSQQIEVGGVPTRYIRNSVKAVVDALTGEVQLYVVDPRDPVIASLEGAFPSLFRSLEEMPDGLRDHLRYPSDLLMIQVRLLQAYHVRDPRALYHQLDLWDLPVERYREGEEVMRPYYVVMPDPTGEDGAPAFLAIYPMTARGRDNLRALIVARGTLEDGPPATVLGLPSEQVLGPRQVEVRIDQDPQISQQFTLWQQRGSRVIRGHLLVIPVEGTFVYVEPIFLEAESGGAAPSLERVVLATADRIAMGTDVDGALAALQSGAGNEAELASGERLDPMGPRLARLRDLIERAEVALRRGDLSSFGQLWSEIRALVAQTGAPANGGTPERH